jgi:hypothetical protein
MKLSVTSPMHVALGDVIVGETIAHNTGSDAVREYAHGLTVAGIERLRNETGRVTHWTFITESGLTTFAHPVGARLLVIHADTERDEES